MLKRNNTPGAPPAWSGVLERVDRRVCGREMRAAGTEEEMHLSGYAAVFNSMTQLWEDFYEVIRPGAFAGALADAGCDIRCLWNHDSNHILGRQAAGTLTIAEDAVGLSYDCLLPNTQFARDLWTSVQRGDVTESSFAFDLWPNGEVVYRETGEQRVREIIRVNMLYDVSPVTYPAYGAATVSARSRDEMVQAFNAPAAGGAAGQAMRARWLQLHGR